MRFLLGLFFTFVSCFTFSQVTADITKYDFGDLYPNAQSYVDITFTNNTDKRQFLLTIDKPRDVYYIFSSKGMDPGESITIRLKINDGLKGRFSHDVDIFFSDSRDPISIRLFGNVKEVASNPLTACPDFNSDPPAPGGGYSYGITIKVIDSLTGEPIRRSKVNVIRNNTVVGTYNTNKDGIVHEDFPLGYYYISAEKETYFSNYSVGYLNFQRNYVLIKLRQPEPEIEEEPEILVTNDPDPPVEEEEPETEEPEEENEIVIDFNDPDPEPEVTIEVDTIPEVPEIVEPEYVDDTPLNELPDTLFDQAHFRTNNITFILDVSSSMNGNGKLELLKQSMYELVEVLRPEDRISIISYSSNVNVVVDGLGGEEKEEINERVAKLRTSSSTAGGDAIKVAYRMNNRIYSPDKNNIVIMITDGAFNRGSKDYKEIIEKNHLEKGIIFSVVGIKTSPYITDHMQEVVSGGGGDFIEIRDTQDAETKIFQEIRRTSFRGR
jgi:Ca-activated chloride channel family protein